MKEEINMFREDKIKKINSMLNKLQECKNILVWGAGIHTSKLLEYTQIGSLNVRYIMDKYNYGQDFYGFEVKNENEVDWDTIDGVVISSHKYQEEIYHYLVSNLQFKGEIIKIYEGNEVNTFFDLISNDVKGIIYKGNYETWEVAEQQTTGYGEANILKKAIEAINKFVEQQTNCSKGANAIYKKEYTYHLLAPMLLCALQNKGRLNILDFGGALGGVYYQNRDLLRSGLSEFTWNVVEQEHFVSYGKMNLQNKELRFENSIDEVVQKSGVDVVLLLSVLPYIKDYNIVVEQILAAEPEFIIIDRTPVGEEERICIQEVPEIICKSSYPLRIFKESALLELFSEKYEVMEKCKSILGKNINLGDLIGYSKIYILRKKEKNV